MRLFPILLLFVGACASSGGRRTLASDQAPKAIGPYAQAVEAGGVVYLAGQIAIDPSTGQMVTGDIVAQTERVLMNLEAVLAAAGLKPQNIVKTTVYMTDLGEFAKMNEVYARWFPTDPPARATVQVVALPKGARIEIEAIARR
jgi:2-iminobutanoate/2-iminopropanoate deaminase